MRFGERIDGGIFNVLESSSAPTRAVSGRGSEEREQTSPNVIRKYINVQ